MKCLTRAVVFLLVFTLVVAAVLSVAFQGEDYSHTGRWNYKFSPYIPDENGFNFKPVLQQEGTLYCTERWCVDFANKQVLECDFTVPELACSGWWGRIGAMTVTVYRETMFDQITGDIFQAWR